MSIPVKPTRREERRAQTVAEIKSLAMEQIRRGGPDAVSLSGIVRDMSMSPAAVYRYFENRDALLADLVVDAYNDFADSLVGADEDSDPLRHLDAVLRASRSWALEHPNAYRLIFQTAIGSGETFASDRTIPAASRSMGVLVEAVSAVAEAREEATTEGGRELGDGMIEALEQWRDRTGITDYSVDVLALAFLAWTRIHGIISLELGGHLASTGIGAQVLFDAEVASIRSDAAALAG